MSDSELFPSAQPALPAPARRKHARRLFRFLLVIFLLLLIAAGALFYVAQYEMGAATLWRYGTGALQGKLSGTYVSGTLARGLHLRDLVYRDKETIIRIDDIDSKWEFSRAPLKLTVAYLRIGTVDARLAPSSSPASLPPGLQLPLALALNSVTLKKMTLHQGLSSTEFGGLLAHGESDSLQHSVMLNRLDTPYGKAEAMLQLNGVAPFALNGSAQLSGAYQQERYQIGVTLGGTLAALGIHLNAGGDKLSGQADIKLTPFAALPFERLELSAEHINPKAFNAGAPTADLALHAALIPLATSAGKGAPSALTVTGPLTLSNAKPGTLDAGYLPLISANAELRLDANTQQLTQLKISLPGKATLNGHGELHQTATKQNELAGNFQFDVSALDLHALHTQLKPTQLHGPLTVKLQAGQQQILLQMEDPQIKVRLDALIDAKTVKLSSAQLSAGPARLDLSGNLTRDAEMTYALQGKLSDFNPASWLNTAPAKSTAKAIGGRINLDFDAAGKLAPELQAQLSFGVRDSEYGGLPMSGKGKLTLAGKRLLASDVQLAVAGNDLRMQGAFGAAADRLHLKLNAPQLAGLGFGLAGLLQLDGQLSGSYARPNLQANVRAEHLVFGAHRLTSLSGQADVQGDLAGDAAALANTRLSIALAGQGYDGAHVALNQFQAHLAGTYGKHTLSVSAAGTVRGKALDLSVAAQGKLTQDKGDAAWDGVITALENRGLPRFALGAPLTVGAGAGRLLLGATRFTLADAPVELKSFGYDHGRIHSEGSAGALNIANLLNLQRELTGVEVPLKTDLVVDARWNFSLAESAGGFAEITRRSGDIIVNTGRGETALGLSELRLRADLQANRVTLDGRAAATRVGQLNAQMQTTLTQDNGTLALSPDMPLSGQATLALVQLKTIGALLGPQYALDGSVTAKLAVAGTVAQPKWSGEVSGDKLALTLYDQGIQLRDGTARIGLSENVIDLRQLEFHGGGGTLKASGKLQLGQANPDLAASIVADHLQIFASPERQLTLSGQAQLASIAEKLRIDGKFKVDRALFDLPKSSAPQLGDDVVIVRRSGKTEAPAPASAQDKMAKTADKPAGRFAPVMNLQVDLGDDFRFRGTGADLKLRGNMEVHSEPFQPLRGSGTVRVVAGTYEAFGRKLAIERGLINFQGALDNPNINILAMRRNQAVEAGVEVTGFARQPRIKLVSEPNVADEEKLSWLMFGHGSESTVLGQQQAAGAALGLLGNAGTKRLAQGIGLDTFSIGASESGLNDQQVVNLGKAISEKFNLGYEQSLTGAASIIKLTWQISQRWSMIARAGAINGLDVLFNRRYD